MSRHVAVWVDHKEARVFHVVPDAVEEKTVHAPAHHLHRHPRGPEGYKEHPEEAQAFFHQVAQVLAGAEEILILGPGVAKLELIKHFHKHDHAIEPKVIGVETVDHPTDPQIVAYARKYFKAADALR